MSKRRKCYSWESSGHWLQPLDGFTAEGGTLVSRLYCPYCGRVIPASEENNDRGVMLRVALPTISDNWTNDPTIVRKSDA